MVYHICNKSIAGFKIFNSKKDFFRIIAAICYYQNNFPKVRLSEFLRLKSNRFENVLDKILAMPKEEKYKLVEIVAYCPMPTHLHLVVEELQKNGVLIFTKNVLNSYTRYFNRKHKRKGPLWEGRTKKICAKTDEQLFYLTMYVHLNPVSAGLVDKPEDWPYSSYKEYIGMCSNGKKICKYSHLLDIEPDEYKKFTKANISRQKEFAKIKKLFLE